MTDLERLGRHVGEQARIDPFPFRDYLVSTYWTCSACADGGVVYAERATGDTAMDALSKVARKAHRVASPDCTAPDNYLTAFHGHVQDIRYDPRLPRV